MGSHGASTAHPMKGTWVRFSALNCLLALQVDALGTKLKADPKEEDEVGGRLA